MFQKPTRLSIEEAATIVDTLTDQPGTHREQIGLMEYVGGMIEGRPVTVFIYIGTGEAFRL